MSWSKLVDMELDDEDKLDAPQPYPMPTKPDYPYGLRISLTEKELKKLGLEMPEKIGDMIDLRAFAVVTCMSQHDNGDGNCCRVELQIQKMSVESEMKE